MAGHRPSRPAGSCRWCRLQHRIAPAGPSRGGGSAWSQGSARTGSAGSAFAIEKGLLRRARFARACGLALPVRARRCRTGGGEQSGHTETKATGKKSRGETKSRRRGLRRLSGPPRGSRGEVAGARYGKTISTRRFCGSRTPSGVGTRGSFMPRPATSISLRGTPRCSRAAATAFARRSESRWL